MHKVFIFVSKSVNIEAESATTVKNSYETVFNLPFLLVERKDAIGLFWREVMKTRRGLHYTIQLVDLPLALTEVVLPGRGES